jgi:glutathione S-transferase
MKLLFAPQSPFARKVRAASMELGLADQIELEYAEVVPSRRNTKYAESINPLRKVPALILNDGRRGPAGASSSAMRDKAGYDAVRPLGT